MRISLLASIIIVIGASAWGVYWIPVREIEAAGIVSGYAVAVFNAPAFLMAVAVCLFFPRPEPGLARLIFLGGLCAGLGLTFYAMGLVLTTVVRATLLFYLTPIWSTLLAILILNERPGLSRWLALALALAGLTLTLGATPADIADGFGLGEALALISGLVWAGAAVAIRMIGETAPPARAIDVRLVAHMYLWIVIVAPLTAWATSAPTPSFGMAVSAITPLVLALSVVILVSLYAIFWAVGRLSPGRSGLLMMSEVVVAVITAAILLPEEAMNAREWIGAALIVGAGAVEVLGGEREDAA